MVLHFGPVEHMGIRPLLITRVSYTLLFAESPLDPPKPSELVPKNSKTDTRGASSAAGWEAEADELLAWTNTLNTEQMLAS